MIVTKDINGSVAAYLSLKGALLLWIFEASIFERDINLMVISIKIVCNIYLYIYISIYINI